MAKKFTVSPNALTRLRLFENGASQRIEEMDASRAEEVLAFRYGCYLTNEDVASALGCTVKTLSTLQLPKVRVGNTIRYNADDVARVIQEGLLAVKG